MKNGRLPIIRPRQAAKGGRDLQEDPAQAMERVLRERALALARPLEMEARAELDLSLLVFPLGEERYAMDLKLVRAVQPLAGHTRVPCTPGFILGLVNIRGRILSLMDLGRFLGLEPRPVSGAAHVIVAASGDMELSILSDGLPEVRALAGSALQPAASAVSERLREFVLGVTQDLCVVLDMERLLADPRIIVHETV